MKKIISVLIVCLLIFNISVLAYTPYISDGVIKVTPITIKDENNVVIKNDFKGKSIIASCEVKKGFEAIDNQSVTLILAIYSNNVLIDMKKSNVILTDSSYKELALTMQVPNQDNLNIRAYVWDDLNNFRPLTECAIFSSSDSSVSEIIINGNKLNEFKQDILNYTVELHSAYLTYPDIVVKTNNTAAEVEIKWDGKIPGNIATANITVTALDNTKTSNYTITFNQQLAKVTNAKGITKNGVENLTVYENVLEPTYKTQPTKPIVVATRDPLYGFSNVITKTKKCSDRDFYWVNLPNELIGSTFISPRVKFIDELVDNNAGGIFNFEINRSATIYTVPLATTYPWINQEGFKQITTADVSNYNLRKLGWAFGTNDSCELQEYTYVVAKDVIVTPEEGTKQVSLGRCQGAFVKFHDEENISNVKMKVGDNDFRNVALTYNLDNAKFNIQQGNSGFTFKDTNVLSANRMISDRTSMYITSIPEFLKGSTGLALPIKVETDFPYITDATKEQIFSFDLKHSSSVYIYCRSELSWLSKQGFTEVTEPNSFIDFYWGGETPQKHTKIYKKDYYVIPGDTLTVTLGGFDNGNNIPNEMIFVNRI